MFANQPYDPHCRSDRSHLRRFMSNELRNFLALSYDELEELNLKAKEQRKNRVALHKDSRRPAQVSDRRKAHQGGDGAVQRSRRPVAHAGLRQEVPDQELGQPDLRRVVDSRVHGAAGKRFAAGDRLVGVLLGSGRLFRLGQSAGVRRCDRQGRHALWRRHSRHPEAVCRQTVQGRRLHPERRQRN